MERVDDVQLAALARRLKEKLHVDNVHDRVPFLPGASQHHAHKDDLEPRHHREPAPYVRLEANNSRDADADGGDDGAADKVDDAQEYEAVAFDVLRRLGKLKQHLEEGEETVRQRDADLDVREREVVLGEADDISEVVLRVEDCVVVGDSRAVDGVGIPPQRFGETAVLKAVFLKVPRLFPAFVAAVLVRRGLVHKVVDPDGDGKEEDGRQELKHGDERRVPRQVVQVVVREVIPFVALGRVVEKIEDLRLWGCPNNPRPAPKRLRLRLGRLTLRCFVAFFLLLREHPVD